MESSLKKLVQRFIQAANDHDVNALGSLVARDLLFSEPFLGPKPLKGVEAYKEDIQEFFTMIPDVKFKASNIVAEGDKAAFELSFVGTQSGSIAGREGPPTNRRMEMTYAIFVEVDSQGLIREMREYYDTGTFYKQTGLKPES
jgi:steroid delta-isomerase-like uncharacterized protein